MTPLARDTPAAPVRIVHLGLGNFFRAHQAWYTSVAADHAEWGIAAFTGRSRPLADALSAQGGLYTLVVRGASEDTFTVLEPVAEAYPGTDLATWCDLVSRPATAIVTLTVTEAGYRRGRDGGLDQDDPDVLADLAALRDADGKPPAGGVVTAPGRLVAGLIARRAAGAGPIAVVCCDNLPGNGAVVARVVTDLATLLDPAGLAGWIRQHVSFVTTMVDRITPETTPDDVAAVAAATGRADAAPVVTEPFTEWVLQGDFPGGRPAWETGGARFVADVEPYEQRKLWLLNGGHSLLAYAGSALGHETVDQATADPRGRDWLAQWWDEAAPHLPLPAPEIADYRAALLDRFANPRIKHRLAQIAADGSQKLPIRILPVLRLERQAGRDAPGAVRILAAWISHLRGAGVPVRDAAAGSFTAAAQGDPDQAVRAVLARLAPDLATDEALISAITASVAGRRASGTLHG